MNDISFTARYARLRTGRYFSRKPAAKIITAFLFIALIGSIAAAVYIGIHTGFTAMNQQTYGKQTLPFYTYEIFFLVMSYLMFLSAIASSFFALSRHDDAWIAATPKFKMLLSRAVRSVFFASLWPLLVLGLPAILALRSVYAGGAMFVLAGLSGLVIVAAIACGLAVALVLAFAELLNAGRALRMRWLVTLTVVVIVATTWAIIRRVLAMNILSLFVSGPINATQASIAGIVAAFRFFPTQLMAFLMLNLQNGAIAAAWADVGWLALVAACIGLAIYLLSFGYLRVWQKLEEGSFEARAQAPVKGGVSGASSGFLRSAKTSVAAIFYKETIANVRNLKNAAWLSFMLALWAVQTGLNIFLRWNISQYGLHAETATAAIQALQLVTAAFFVSAFVLRFVLPSFSGERRMAWILGTAPVSVRRIFLSKLGFYGTLFIGLGLVLGVVNSAVLGASLLHTVAFLLVLGTMIACTTVFGFSLGTLFPDTESDDPEAVSTSLPGLAFTFASLLYGAAGAWLYYLGLTASGTAGLGVFVAVSLALILAMTALTVHALKTFNPFAEESLGV
jgi:hypothetical protein